MMVHSAGVWLLPTNNPVKLRRFLTYAREMGVSTRGWVVINESDRQDYESIKAFLPVGWEYRRVKAQCYGDAVRACWEWTKDMPWVGLVADDLVPCSSGWDVKLIAELQGWNMVSSNDGWQAQNEDITRSRIHGALVISGDLMRTIGWLFPPNLKHIFHDDFLENIGRAGPCWQIKVEVLVKHLHEALEGKRGPTMDPNSDLWKHDEAIFKSWMEKPVEEPDGFASVVSRVKALMERSGVKTFMPDFTGLSLMIATPSIDGTYQGDYVIGLYRTMEALRQYKCNSRWSEERYTADIALARSKILASFLRSDCSHLLMVDADMGWEPKDVMRMLAAKKDFVAVAGPKKRYPLTFAANWTDDKGNPKALEYDPNSGTIEVSEIGCAFVLITRSCAERVYKGYPELTYIGMTGEQERLVFAPMVWHKRIMSEDWAFCKRWRGVGGTVHMIPDIALKHIGTHCFQGSFRQAIEEQQREAARIAEQEQQRKSSESAQAMLTAAE